MQEIADPTTIAPEVCVEVMCPTNTEDEMRDKIELYLEARTEEVWIVGEDGGIQFFGEEDQMEQSRMVPDGPASV